MTDRLIVAIREASGMEVLQTGAAARPILRALKEGCVVGILADQDVAERGVFVRLLGREASTAKGPVVLAHRTGAPLLTAFLHREGAGRHRLVYQPELPLTGDASADTQAWTDRLSREVETRPDHWLWLHDRWKSQRRDDGTIVRVRNPPPGWRP